MHSPHLPEAHAPHAEHDASKRAVAVVDAGRDVLVQDHDAGAKAVAAANGDMVAAVMKVVAR